MDGVRSDETGLVSITVLSVTPARAGKLFALTSVEVDIDGVQITIHGVRALRVDSVGTRIELPKFRDSSGVLRSAVTLPDEIRGPIGDAVLDELVERGLADRAALMCRRLRDKPYPLRGLNFMETHQTEAQRAARFAAYIEARKFDPPRPLLMAAAALVDGKHHGLDVGAGALNATKYLISTGFEHVTALDASLHAQKIAEELPNDQVTFVLSRFEDFTFLPEHYDLINAEFSLPFINSDHFAQTFNDLLGSIKRGGIFTGQLFGPNDSWNVESSEMTFHTRAAIEAYLRDFELLQFMEEDHPGTTKLGEPKHWHIFHIIARKTPEQAARGR